MQASWPHWPHSWLQDNRSGVWRSFWWSWYLFERIGSWLTSPASIVANRTARHCLLIWRSAQAQKAAMIRCSERRRSAYLRLCLIEGWRIVIRWNQILIRGEEKAEAWKIRLFVNRGCVWTLELSMHNRRRKRSPSQNDQMFGTASIYFQVLHKGTIKIIVIREFQHHTTFKQKVCSMESHENFTR